ncbi:hypothetical protein BN1708_019247, partial [Verticillium longisporum]
EQPGAQADGPAQAEAAAAGHQQGDVLGQRAAGVRARAAGRAQQVLRLRRRHTHPRQPGARHRQVRVLVVDAARRRHGQEQLRVHDPRAGVQGHPQPGRRLQALQRLAAAHRRLRREQLRRLEPRSRCQPRRRVSADPHSLF